ncbi:response regulator [Desulfovibrio sp. OttesenSCG-928-A18]|nr:response regulator [Desulfovibrio sp. OttesenSCG-928-A18]
MLVVDDIDINLYVAEAMLEEYGIRCTLSTSWAEAVELVQQKDFDLVFMDHMMPGMDGIATTRAIRALGGKYADLPIVVLTANVVGEARSMFAQAGMDDFLPKPLEANKLGGILRRWLPGEKIFER